MFEPISHQPSTINSPPLPLVSVIIATYNRSNILRLAIESVRWQTHAEWELIVVGDCCTDDTAEVVSSFGDPRIRFHNRATNFGEQSGPNNDGLRLARGAFIAFLNHDDLWLPRHLADALELLQDAHADLVYARRFDLGDVVPYTDPPPGTAGYLPRHIVMASCWVFRRELIEEIGRWRPAARLYNAPSQDWLWRVHRAGKRIRATARVNVLVIASTVATDSYRRRSSEVQSKWFARLREQPEFEPPEHAPERLEVSGLGGLARLREVVTKRRSWRGIRESLPFLWPALIRLLARRLEPLGFHPIAVTEFFRGWGRRGMMVRNLRARRGLDPAKISKGDPR